eukprot:1496194-Alexandrium_andersonii.AAC.1
MKSLELAAASAHLALCDPRSHCSLGSLTLSPVPPLRVAMAAASKSGEAVKKEVGQTGGLPADRSSPPRG